VEAKEVIFSNLGQYENELYPQLLEAVKTLDEGKAAGVRYDLIEKYLTLADGTAMRIIEGFRSVGKQNGLWEKGQKTGVKAVTKAKGGQSYHQWGLAVDMVFRRPGWGKAEIEGIVYDFATVKPYQYLGLADYWRRCGLVWGGFWDDLNDMSHVELRAVHPTDLTLCGTAWWKPVEVEEVKEPKKEIGVTWYVAGIVAAAAAVLYFWKKRNNWGGKKVVLA